MKNNLKIEDLGFNINVNANEAQKNINNLGREITDTTYKIKELQQQQAQLAKEGLKDSDAYKALTKEIKLNKDKVKELNAEQGKQINNLSLEQKTISQLQRQLTDLRKLRSNSIPESEQSAQYSKQIEIVSSRLKELQIGTELTGRSVDNLGGKFKGWIATATATAVSITSIALGFRKAINEYAAFDDLLVDVMKTTNLSKDSVKELNEELKEIETRTSQEDLLGLGRIAGKLGYTEISDIVEFIKSNNQIIVALNEDLGGNVEETVNKIGKLVDIFKLKDIYTTEEAFLKVGSAINELGMASTANEGYMVEFARRMAGVAPLAKVSIDQILGLGAALDQLGQTEEVSSTALSKLFLKLASESKTYSKYAGMQLNDFKNLLEKDFMGAFTKVLQGVKDNANGVNELAATLGDLGEDGGRVIGVIGSLANNVEILHSSMNLANSAMIDGTSITEEYNLKNESAAAKLEKAQKKVKELWVELGEKLWPVLTSGLNLFSMFLSILSKIIVFLSNHSKVIFTLTSAIVAYNAVVFLSNVQLKENIILTAKKILGEKLAAQISLLYAAAQLRLTGNILGANLAMAAFNNSIKANPIGLAIAAIVGLTAAIYAYANSASTAEIAQKKVNDEMISAKKATEDLKNSTRELVETIKDSNLTRYTQAKAFLELQRLYPEHLGNMSLEEFQTKSTGEAMTNLNKVMEEKEKLLANSNYNKAAKEAEGLRAEIEHLVQSLGGTKSDGGLIQLIKQKEQALAVAEERMKQYGAEIDKINKIEFETKPVEEKIKHYETILAKLTKQKENLEIQNNLVNDLSRGWNVFDRLINRTSLDNVILQIENIHKKLNSYSPKSTTEVESNANDNISKRRESLKNRYDSLVALYETYSVSDIKSRNKNLADRKKIQDQLDDLDGKKTSSNSSSSDSKRKKAYQKELEDSEKHYQALLQQKGLFREDLSELDKAQLIELAKYQNDYQLKQDAINKKYGENLKTVTNTANQELKKREKAETDYINSILIKKQTEGEAEIAAYQDRLVKSGLFGIDKEKLTERQLRALEILEKEHQKNMNKIDSDAISKEIDARISKNEDQVRALRIEHQKELSEIKSLSQAKETLSKWMSDKEISEYKNLSEAKEAIQEQQMLDEETLLKEQLIKLLTLLKKAQETGNFDGMVMADDIFSEEELKVFKDKAVEVEEILLKLRGKKEKESKDSEARKKVDVLGMSYEDWDNFFNNIGTSREKLQGLYGALSAFTQLWSQYNSLVAAKENAQLQKDESANNIKKDRLKKRLDEGIISQEEYNKQVEKLDKDMDRKKAIVARNQAKRDRNVALMSAIVNTAKAITEVLANPILVAIVAAMGALQIGTILATPLPEVPGAESGGNFLDVIRAQDGKKFRAKSDPNKRGFISSPTVLVGEKGKEWVANNDAVENPHIKPLLDVLDTAQRNGQINTLTLSDIASSLSSRVQGRQSGGSIAGSVAPSRNGNDGNASLEVVLKKTISTLEALHDRLENLEVSVTLLGKNGFIEKMDEYNKLKNNGSF